MAIITFSDFWTKQDVTFRCNITDSTAVYTYQQLVFNQPKNGGYFVDY